MSVACPSACQAAATFCRFGYVLLSLCPLSARLSVRVLLNTKLQANEQLPFFMPLCFAFLINIINVCAWQTKGQVHCAMSFTLSSSPSLSLYLSLPLALSRFLCVSRASEDWLAAPWSHPQTCVPND